VGTSSARSNIDGGNTPQTQFEGVGYPGATISLTRNSADSGAPGFYFAKTRSASVGGIAAAQAGDTVGQIIWTASDGTNTIKAAAIDAYVDGTPGPNDMPGRLVFSTTADGSATPTERMRIDSLGRVGINTTTVQSILHLSTTNLSDLRFTTTAETTDQKNWVFQTGTAIGAGTFRLRAINDANTDGQNAYILTKSGTSIQTHQWLTAGYERLRLTSDGKLGLGTSSPGSYEDYASKLVVANTAGNNGMTIVSASNGVGALFFADGTVGNEKNRGGIYYSHIDDSLQALTAGSARVHITSGGNVGIGTTSPNAKLNVSESTGASLFRLNGLNTYNLDITNNYDSGTRFDFNIGSGSGAC